MKLHFAVGALALVIGFFLSSFFFFSETDAVTEMSVAVGEACIGPLNEERTCVGIGYTVDGAIQDGHKKCATKCEETIRAYCGILCKSRKGCVCKPIPSESVECKLADPSCIVYDRNGDVDGRKTTGSPCVVDCKTQCQATCEKPRSSPIRRDE